MSDRTASAADRDLRETFDQAALDYDAVRPGYPEALVDDVIALADLAPADSILEVGCGTGQATLPFARRGHPMVCLDIGENMLTVAREKCRAFPQVQFARAAFEDWDPAGRAFALTLSATAFHWVPAAVRYHRAAEALVPGGRLAILAHYHPRPYTEFFHRVQTVYRQVAPEWGDPTAGPADDEKIAAAVAEFDASRRFGEVTVRRHPWSCRLTSERYVRLLNTFSGHLALDTERRQALFDGVAAVIDDEFGGAIERPYLSVLYIARAQKP